MIDVVYTWVDGGRPDYWDLLRQYSDKRLDLNPERYRDDYQLLRYSLRSLAAFAPWVGNIYLFTTRPHVPGWLQADHPQIRVVHHDEVFEDPAVLPTFNSNTIETQLDRLPCSDPFLYFNDDYLLGCPTEPEFFCDRRGRIRVFGTLLGERFAWRMRDAGLSLGFTEHTPLWVVKRWWRAAQDLYPVARHLTLHSRFRQADNLRMERAYRYYLLAHTRERSTVYFYQALRDVIFHKITNDAARQQRLLQRISRRRPHLLCLNDDQRDHPNPEVVAMTQSFLRSYYPQPSPWEKPL